MVSLRGRSLPTSTFTVGLNGPDRKVTSSTQSHRHSCGHTTDFPRVGKGVKSGGARGYQYTGLESGERGAGSTSHVEKINGRKRVGTTAIEASLITA